MVEKRLLSNVTKWVERYTRSTIRRSAPIYPPVGVDGRVLVDGGAMNDVPEDVARGLGGDRVIAVQVGDLKGRVQAWRSRSRPLSSG